MVARTGDGRLVRCHLADPGRLKELLLPDAPLRLRPVAPGSVRKTRFTVSLVRSPEPPRAWVSVEAARANRLAAKLLRDGKVHGIDRGWEVRGEVRHGRSRFDFLLSRADCRILVEVKSVTLVERGVARFPDAPTARGTRHVRELERLARNGGAALILFVVQRGDVRTVKPARQIDPDFADALADADRAGVLLRAARFRLDASGRARHLGPARVRLT